MSLPYSRTSVRRSHFVNRTNSRIKPTRLTLLLGLTLFASAALATSAFSAGSLRQLIFGSAAIVGHADHSPENASVAMSYATLPQGGATLNVARRGHSATRLADGRVLIAGGENSGGSLSDAEIFDPATGAFTVIGNMGGARADHAAVKLSDGRVLLMGGRNGAGAVNSTEIFDPTTGAFASGPAISVARAGHSATLFADGRVLIAGGDANGSAELFDVSSGGTAVGALGGVRSMHSAALLQDGRVLIVGGRDADGNSLDSGEIFDTTAGTFSAVDSNLKVARAGALLRVLFDGKVQIIGGSSDGSMEIYDPVIEEFGAYAHVLPESDPCVGLVSQIMASQTRAALFHNGQADALLDRVGHTITELSGQALVVGGANSSGAVLDSFSVLASSSAAITTDKLDYKPGDVVAISGRGFQPGETVRVKIHEDPHTPQERGFDAVADSSGNFSGEYVVQDYDLSMKFIVGARGLTSGATAQTTFTDGNFDVKTSGPTYTLVREIFNPNTNCSGSPVSTATETVTLATPVQFSINANTKSVRLTVQGPPAGFLNWSTASLSGSVSVFSNVGNVICLNTPNANGSGQATANFASTATTTAVTSSQDPSVYGQAVTFTATVTPTSGVTPPTGSVQFQIDGVNFGAPVTLSPSGSNGVANSGSISTLNVADSPHAITAIYTPTGSYTGSTSPIFNQDVNKADQTIIFAALPDKTYGDAAFVVSATGGASGNPVTFSASGNCTSTGLNGSTITITGAGSCTVTASQAGNANYNAAPNVDQSFDINKADATFTVTPYNVTYDGLAHTATVSTITGVNGETGATVGTVDVSGTTHTNAGSYLADPWTFTGTANYNNSNGTVNDNIDKANASFTVTPYNVTYDGQPHTASVSTITGVNGETGATVGTVDVTGTTHTNAGSYLNEIGSVTGRANYNDSNGTVADNIDKANASFTVTPYNVTYDGQPHTATVSTITGVNGETGATVGTVDVSGTTHTNAGSYLNDPWSFTGTANYNNSNGTVDDNIDKANASFTVTPSNVTYVGPPHPATVSTITGVNGETGATVGTVDVSGTTHTNAGSYLNDPWSFTGTANYNNSNGTVDDNIDKADATFTVTPYNVTYDGQPHTATVSTITGVNGETGATVGTLDVSGTTHTNAGSYLNDPWSFTGTANYNNSNGTVDDNIDKANASFTVTPYNVTYDGQPHTASVSTITGVNGETGATVGTVDVTGTTHTNAGSYLNEIGSVTGRANYNDSNGTVADNIDKANASFTVTPYNVTYDGQPHTATVSTITGVNGETGATVGTVDVSGTTHTNAGSYLNDPWSFTGTANYNNSNGTVDDNIDKANASFTVTPSNVTYVGPPHPATVSTITGVNGETGATVGTVDVSGTTHTNAGSYLNDPWSFTGTANYNNSNGTVDDNIDKADATFTVTPYNVTYDGQPHTATVSTITGVNGETGATVGTVDVSGTTHTNAGSYLNDPWSFTGTANYNNSNGTVDDNIDKANASFTVTPSNVTYVGPPHPATVSTITGVNGETGATVGTVDVSGTTHTNAGSYLNDPWSFTGTANYNNSNGTVDDNIDKADATFTVTPYNVTYDGQPHTATVSTITGVNGETGATVGTVDVSGTTHTNAGSYLNDPWSFTGTANYNNSNGTVDDNIDKANASFTVTPYNVTYDGLAHTATVSTITGVNGETGATVGPVDVSGTTHTNAGSYLNDPWSFTGTGNYNNSNGTVDDNIDKADATFTVTPSNVTYVGPPHTATVSTITGVNGETGATVGTVDVSGTTHTNAGSYLNDPWSFTGTANYNNSNGTVDDNIDKADATFTVTPYNVTYDGQPHTATVSTITGVNGETGATVGTVDGTEETRV